MEGVAGEADTGDGGVEIMVTAEDFNFEAEIINGDGRSQVRGEADGVFFGGDDNIGLGADGAAKESFHFLRGEAVMVEEAFVVANFGALLAEELFETLGRGDAAEGGDAEAAQIREGADAEAIDGLQMLRAVGTDDDFDLGMVAGNYLAQFVVGLAVGFGNEDVGGAAEVADRLAEDAAGQKAVVAEGVGFVHQEEIELAAEREVLEAVVEEENVGAKFLDGVLAGLDSVFVHQHNDAGEIAGEHEGLVPGFGGIEEDVLAVADDLGRGVLAVAEPAPPADIKRLGAAFVTAAEDGDVAAALGEGTGEFFDDGGLARAADGEVADHDDRDAQGLIAEQDALAVEPNAHTDHAVKYEGEDRKRASKEGNADAILAPVVHHVHGEFLKLPRADGHTFQPAGRHGGLISGNGRRFQSRVDGRGGTRKIRPLRALRTHSPRISANIPAEMQLHLLRSKILRAEVTDARLEYEGSLAIDSALMERVGILPHEKVLVGNLANGNRFETYAIAAPAGSLTICLNGAAAHLGQKGDLLVIMTFGVMSEEEAKTWKPRTVVLAEGNKKIVKETGTLNV